MGSNPVGVTIRPARVRLAGLFSWHARRPLAVAAAAVLGRQDPGAQARGWALGVRRAPLDAQAGARPAARVEDPAGCAVGAGPLEVVRVFQDSNHDMRVGPPE